MKLGKFTIVFWSIGTIASLLLTISTTLDLFYAKEKSDEIVRNTTEAAFLFLNIPKNENRSYSKISHKENHTILQSSNKILNKSSVWKEKIEEVKNEIDKKQNIQEMPKLQQENRNSTKIVTKESIDSIEKLNPKEVCVRSEGKQCMKFYCQNGRTLSKPVVPHFAEAKLILDSKVKGKPMRIAGAADWGSGCALSHKHKFIYVHVHKSGGSTFKSFLKRALIGKERHISRTSAVLQPAHCRNAIQVYKRYFSFSFVRNPFSRMYSAYAMAMSNTYLVDDDKTISYHDFVMDKRARTIYSELSSSHYYPQANFLFDLNTGECPVVDFIGKLEHIQRDFEYVLERINSTELLNYYYNISNRTLMQINNWGSNAKRKKLNGTLANAYRNNQTMVKVTEEFDRDFRLFGYTKDLLPDD